MFSTYTGSVLYTAIFLFYIFSLISLKDVGKSSKEVVQEDVKVLGQFRLYFFTLWTFMLQIIFIITAILDDASKILALSTSLQKSLGRTRAFLFNTLVFPCSLVVVSVFWTLWHIDRALIFPKTLDVLFPTWLNHVLHSFIIIPLLIEVTLPKKKYFVKFKDAALILTIYSTIYQSLYLSVYLRYSVWLYPVYGVLNWTQRILFSLFQLGLCIFYLKVGIAIQDRKRIKVGKIA